MICACGHHMGAHRPFCRDCDFNTAGCRGFVLDAEATFKAIAPIPMPAPGTALVYRDGKWQPDKAYIENILRVDDDRRQCLLYGDWDANDDGVMHRQVNRDDDAYEAHLHIEPAFKNIPIRVDPTLPKGCIAIEGAGERRTIINIEGASGDPTPDS